MQDKDLYYKILYKKQLRFMEINIIMIMSNIETQEQK